MLAQLVGLTALSDLSLPFSLGQPELRVLSRLPALCELRSVGDLVLDPDLMTHPTTSGDSSRDPLAAAAWRVRLPLESVTTLMVSSLSFTRLASPEADGRLLATLMPALRQVNLRVLGDREASALARCEGLDSISAYTAK